VGTSLETEPLCEYAVDETNAKKEERRKIYGVLSIA